MKINIVKYIPELLCRHDCVIIPGFGGFIGNYSPATINPVYHTFYPPSKSLLFNIHLKQNDGLLVSFVAQCELVTYERAMELVNIMREEWNLELENSGELIIEKVGKIVKEANGIFQFEQDNTVNYLPEAYGLTSLVSPAIRRSGVQDKIEKKFEQYSTTPAGRKRKLSPPLKWAAVMALPIGMAVYFSLTNIDQIRNLQQNYTGFLFSNSSPASKPVTPTKGQDKGHDMSCPYVKVVPSEKVIKTEPKVPLIQADVNPIVQPDKPEVKAKPIDSQNPYAIIVGAFKFRENAENMVARLKQDGFEAGIYDMTKTGLYRVSLSTYANHEDAIGQLNAVRLKNYSSAWLLSK